MPGPKIIEMSSFERSSRKAATEHATGVRSTPKGWIAIRAGRLVGGPHGGSRGFLQASREAGTREVLR